MKPCLRLSLASLLFSLLAGLASAADAPKLFTEGVRSTEPLSPEEQRLKFHLPPGFKIQLVAAEPDLRKPMNMAFDSAGRLWVTESREYPFAATNAALARDTIRIFSDFDDNGRARKVTTFATNLNIPIGVYPFRSPASNAPKPNPNSPSPITQPLTWKCIAWSIPNIWLFEDTDGDGVADKQEVLYGPFDHTRDTHGNQASFRRGLDGWIYATHGFNNQSRVAGRDGHEIFLPSGNVYRFRLDGSRIEHWTHGQVNPFGLCFDPLGNLYSADCHSSPIYQLLRGAHYPSFGRPHDGLGFGPTTIQHSHGSTAICGITHISDPSWPAEFQGNLFIGNVMTSRINRDRLEWRGSTSVGHEMPDFLSTDDPWFRPVDLQFGPDGALWVADFYNRIIGHYEVPLLHPGRDRERGRIWRIVPPQGSARGPRAVSGGPPDTRPSDLAAEKKSVEQASGGPPEAARGPRALPDFTRASRDALLHELLGHNPTRAALAREELALRPDPDLPARLLGAARGEWHFHMEDNRKGLMTSALWLLQRAGALDDQTLLKALQDRDEAARVHALRILTERGLRIAAQSKGPALPASPPLPAGEGRGEGERPLAPSAPLLAATRTALADPSAQVQRAAADALAANPHADNLAPLLALQKRVPAEDTHLVHVVRLALREQLRLPGAFAKLSGEPLPPADARAFAALATSLTNAEAASFLVRHVEQHTEPADVLARYVTHAARYAPDADLPKLASLGRKQFAADLDTQAALFKAMHDGLTVRGGALPPDLRAWGTDLAGQLLAPSAKAAAWSYVPLNPAQPGRNPFAFEERTSADGQKTRLMSSFPHGETLTGILRSPVFVLPKQLSFYLCGHDGFPQQPAGGKNFVRLRLVEDTDKAEAGRARLSQRADMMSEQSGGALGTGAPYHPQFYHPESISSAAGIPAVLPHPSPLPLGEGNRSTAKGSGQSVLASKWLAFSPRRLASPPLPAGEGRGEGESCLEPVGFSSQPTCTTFRPAECTEEPLLLYSSQTDTPSERIGAPPGRRRDADSTRLDHVPTRPALNPTRRDDVPTRLGVNPARPDLIPTRLAAAQTRPDPTPTRLAIAPTRPEVAPTRREDDSTRLAPVPTRLAAAPAAGALPKGVVREVKVPRNDIAQKITWDLADLAGKRAVIEVTDGDDGKAYAWLAFGRFEPALPELTLGEVQSLARRQQSGAELARSLKLATLEPAVTKLFNDSTDASVRAAAGRAWLSLNAVAALPKVELLVRDAAQPETLRAELAAQLGEQADARGLAVVVAALTNAPTRLQTRFAAALVSTAAGAEQLLAAAEAGRIPARLLQDRTLTDRLRASPAREAKNRLAALVKNLPAADVQLQKLIEAKRAGFDAKQANASRGAEVFTKACVACHQLAGQGALVGPQLDGIGGRGLERLLEDILDPNRNVDKAFRTTVFVLKDGETVSGLQRREEGGAFIYALANGQEARVSKADVKERRETETSLMPANFHEALTPAELNDLLTFLLGKTGK